MSGRPAPVRGRNAFRALSESGRRARTGAVTVQFAAASDGDVRVAYVVARRIGGAVVRNRWRRRVRAIAAEIVGELPSGAYLIVLGARAVSLDFDELREQVKDTMRRASGTER